MARGSRSVETTMSGDDSTSEDLHFSAGIRFVLVEVGKLTATVNRLVDDVKDLKHQVEGIKHQVSFVKGAVWASVAFLTLLVGVLSFFFSAKWNALEAVVRAALRQ